MGSDLVDKAQPRLARTVEHLTEELKSIRTGRAAPSLLEDLPVEAYNQPMSVKQLAAISTPDAKSLTITPWDPTLLAAIEKAIRENKQLDLNPVNDGKSLHINVPPLTTERREQLIKQVGEKVESCYISLRNVRHEVLNEAKRLEKAKSISEDDYNLVEKQITAKIEELRKQIEDTAEAKRQEIREI